MVKSRRRRCAETLSLQVRADLEIGVDCLRRANPKVRTLTVAECPSATFRGVVGRLLRRIAQECAQTGEVIGIQMLLLSAQRR